MQKKGIDMMLGAIIAVIVVLVITLIVWMALKGRLDLFKTLG